MNRRSILACVSRAAAAGVLGVLLASPIAAAQVTAAEQFRSAHLPIANLEVRSVGGILVIRGETSQTSAVDSASQLASSLGYTRVANLVRVIDAPDDALLQRRAERQLGETRSLDGCNLRVASSNGILRVDGTVHYELQKDVATQILRNIDGVRGVEATLRRN